MKKLLFLVSVIFSGYVFADNIGIIDDELEQLRSNIEHCRATNGKVVTLLAKFDTKKGLISGVKEKFCEYESDSNVGIVGLKTLSQEPTIAATYIQRLVINDKLPFTPTNPNPSAVVCKALNGTEIAFHVRNGGFSDERGQFDICVFGDGSSISAWTLIYTAIGQRNDIKEHIRSTPLELPNLKHLKNLSLR